MLGRHRQCRNHSGQLEDSPDPELQSDRVDMSDQNHTPSEDSFEWIDTPAAPASEPSARDYGVRTTSVSRLDGKQRLQRQLGGCGLKQHSGLTTTTVSRHQKRPSPRRCCRQRELLQHAPLLPPSSSPLLHLPKGRRRLQDVALLRRPDRHPDPHGLLDRRVEPLPAQEREGQVPRQPDRALPHVPQRGGSGEVPWPEQDPVGELPGEVLRRPDRLQRRRARDPGVPSRLGQLPLHPEPFLVLPDRHDARSHHAHAFPRRVFSPPSHRYHATNNRRHSQTRSKCATTTTAATTSTAGSSAPA